MSRDLKTNRIEGEIKVHEKEMMEKARLKRLAELEKTFTTLKHILDAIREEKISYGINKEYYFVTDEDGDLIFLKRDDENSAHQKELDKHKQIREQWPENKYDGKILWQQNTYEKRGLAITKMFFNALYLDYLG